MSKIWKQISRIGLIVNGLIAFTFNSAMAKRPPEVITQATPISHKSKDAVVEKKTNTQIAVAPDSSSQTELLNACSEEGNRIVVSVSEVETASRLVCDPGSPFLCIDRDGQVTECTECCPNGL
ncbi:MAG TPA: hypothetical protein VK184_08625 [Nostocaceae cyanobacterium]|nr:hypothetical protein [Nostocaceae cyanobacterium]